MEKLLKGNYEVENFVETKTDGDPVSEKALFESRALERLGGSIAFVMKGNKLVWDEEDLDSDSK